MSRQMKPEIILLLLCVCSSSLSSGWPSLISSLASSGINAMGGGSGDDKKKEEETDTQPDNTTGTNCKVKLYKGKNFEGDLLELDRSITALKPDGFDNEVSSVKYEGECSNVIIYEHPDYTGAMFNVLDSPEDDRMEFDNFNDRASSVKIE